MRRLVLVAAVTLVLAPGAAAEPLTAGTGPCPPKKGKRVEVLQRTGQAVVFMRGPRTIACWRPSGKVWALGRGVVVSELAGERLAFGAGASVRVATLSGGDAVEVGTAVDVGAPVSGARVASIVLRGDGAVAWIGEARSGGAAVAQVRQVGGLLGSGSGIEGDSLRLRGDRVAWTQSGIERSAPLTLPEPAQPGGGAPDAR